MIQTGSIPSLRNKRPRLLRYCKISLKTLVRPSCCFYSESRWSSAIVEVLPQMAKILEKLQLKLNSFVKLNNLNWVHALFIDLRKASDPVGHSIFLQKLAKMNVIRSMWLGTPRFLKGRSQRVNIAETLSLTKPCHAWVPQGSLIFPLLSDVYVYFESSVPDYLFINTCKYADDCTQNEVVAQELYARHSGRIAKLGC